MSERAFLSRARGSYGEWAGRDGHGRRHKQNWPSRSEGTSEAAEGDPRWASRTERHSSISTTSSGASLLASLSLVTTLRARTGPRRVTPRRLPGRADTPGTGTPAERRRWGPAAALTVAVRLARATGRTAEAARPNEAVLAMGDVDTHAENRRDERRALVILVATRAPRLALSTVSTAFSWLRCAGRFPRSTTSPWLGTVQIESAVHEK